MAKHYIYHIFNVKIGCSNNVEKRIKQQGYKEGEYEILEEHTNAKTASVREQELQREYGYAVDKIQYWKTIRNQKKSSSKEARAKAMAKIDWVASRAKVDWVAANKKRIPKIDFKAVAAKKDWKSITAKIDYKASRAKVDWVKAHKEAGTHANRDWKEYSKKMSKAITQYNLVGQFIRHWNSATEAAKELKLKNTTCISACLKGNQKTAHGYKWDYKK